MIEDIEKSCWKYRFEFDEELREYVGKRYETYHINKEFSIRRLNDMCDDFMKDDRNKVGTLIEISFISVAFNMHMIKRKHCL